MGIPNLLRLLKPYVEPVHIKKYSGKRVGIDAYSWLHKGAYSCSMELCLNKQGEAARRYLRYFMHHINLLKHHNITPVVVFDGCNIPSKSSTDDARTKKRQENLVLAEEKLREGNVMAAVDYFRKAVWISPDMAHQLIQILRKENVEFVVAPYEADAQLAYLANIEAQEGGVAAVITEDSDLMAYGCPAIIFKMDRHGHGDEIILDKVLSSTRNGLSFQHFDQELFTGMCVLAGCDFLPSVPGIGIKRAYSLVSKHRNIDLALSALSTEKGSLMPEDYCCSFKKAIAIFSHARIYDFKSKQVKSMRPLPDEILQALNDDLDFLGPELSPEIGAAIAEGLLNPITMEAFDSKQSSQPAADFAEYPIILDIIPKKESCFTLFSARVEVKENITTDVLFNSSKYQHEAFALRKLSKPMALYHSKSENEIEHADIPRNNPFKKKKVNPMESVEIEQAAVVLGPDLTDAVASCSSVGETEAETPVVIAADSEKLKDKTRCQALGSKKNGILRFFSWLG
ncbi:5'-3' exonuclease family protein isoform X2 [Wolffia australiana]